jgi:hypothetical protein
VGAAARRAGPAGAAAPRRTLMDGPDRSRAAAQRQDLELCDAAKFLVEECRMLLPGIQALFGFQLVAVFDRDFFERLTYHEQILHLVATGLIAMAIGLIMTPAAYHRQTTPQTITLTFIRLCTHLMLWAMVPMTLGLCIDFYVVMLAVTHLAWTVVFAIALLAYFAGLWFVLPRWYKPL